MADYQLNISHNQNYNISKGEAIEILNSYKRHRIGQPIAIAYTENGKRELLLAIGKRNYDDPIGDRGFGEEFYEIINSGDGGDGEDLMWEILTD